MKNSAVDASTRSAGYGCMVAGVFTARWLGCNAVVPPLEMDLQRVAVLRNTAGLAVWWRMGAVTAYTL